MSRFVLDCSVAMAWCFEDEPDAQAYANSVLGALETDSAVAPSIWPLEIANVLAVAERKDRLREAESARFLELLHLLPIEIDPHTHARATGPILALARRRGLSSYDAAYLDLAMREGLPLASLDKALVAAAESSGVTPLAFA